MINNLPTTADYPNATWHYHRAARDYIIAMPHLMPGIKRKQYETLCRRKTGKFLTSLLMRFPAEFKWMGWLICSSNFPYAEWHRTFSHIRRITPLPQIHTCWSCSEKMTFDELRSCSGCGFGFCEPCLDLDFDALPFCYRCYQIFEEVQR